MAFQEIFDVLNTRTPTLISRGLKSGFYYHALPPGPSILGTTCSGNGGLLILSRFPIEKQEFKPYKLANYSDQIAQKGILYAKIVI
jgi:hypothetical protein